jgi:lantibiotic transport system permease protein
MNAFFCSLRAEALKTKRTLALILTWVAPVVIVMLVSAFYLQHADYYAPKKGINPWTTYSQMILVYWNLLMLPLFITLETALITQLEHGRKNWKLIFTTPLPRWTVYASKQGIILGWIALSYGALLALMAVSGGVLQWIHPIYGLNAAVPWGEILRLAVTTYLASWFMISFHLWVSTHWSSFVVATGTGIAATIVSLFIFGDDSAAYFPWSIPGVLSIDGGSGINVGVSLAIGLLGGLVIALLGGWDAARQDVA